MKRLLLTIFLLFTAMSVFSQDMTAYTNEYRREDGTFTERLALLEAVRDAKLTGIGEFYHDALKFLITRVPDIRTSTEQNAAERSAILLCQVLGAEKYSAAASDIWQIVELFDIVRIGINADTMQTAIITLGEIDAKEFVPSIVQRLNNFNTQTITDPDTRRRVQMVVIGCIRALENLHDIRGYRPVFFVSVGTYDPPVRNIAGEALPNIVEDPCDVIIEIIRDSSNVPRTKLTAWNEMLKTRAPESSKARVAAAAIEVSWTYSTNDRSNQTVLKDMRKSAIDTVRQYGIADASVYPYLERSYSTNLNTNQPDYDEVMRTLNTLAAVRTDEAVELLRKFLAELNERRRTGPWGNKERQLFEWVVSCIGATRTQSVEVRILLTTMERTSAYTNQERIMIRNALNQISAR